MPAVRHVGILMAPRVFGAAVVQLNFWINTRLASMMTVGSVTGVSWALTIMLMPQSIIAQSVAMAALPTLSAQYALGKMDDLRASLAASLRGIMLLALPASFGLILLREPIVALLLQYGEFDEHSTQLISWALLWYAVGLVGHCIVEILYRAFYALHKPLHQCWLFQAMGLNILQAWCPPPVW
jgi:putative peptidoglycan lipid II flippase